MSAKLQDADDWTILPQQILTPEEIHSNNKNDVVYARYDNILIDCGSDFFSTSELCYPNFQHAHGSNGGKKRRCDVSGVKLDSYEAVCKSILKMIAKSKAKSNTNNTIIGIIKIIFSHLKRLKQHNSDFPANRADSRALLSEYLNGWHEEIKLYCQRNAQTGQSRIGRSPNTLAYHQLALITLMMEHANISRVELTQGLKLVKKSESAATITQPIQFEELARQFNYFTQMFRKLSNIVLNDIQLPQSVQLFDAVNEESYTIHIAPASQFICLEPECSRTRSNRGLITWFNFETGQFYLPSVMIENGWTTQKSVTIVRENIRQSYNKANKPFSGCRKSLIKHALYCYFMHFLILTGVNDSVAANIDYFEDFTVSRAGTVGYSVIKYRAGHAEQSFELQTEFIEDFKFYLKLRKYTVQHERNNNKPVIDNKLFINYSEARENGSRVKPLPNNGQATTNILKYLKKKIPFPVDTSRVLRTTKGRWIRKHYGVEVAAYVLEHSTSTALKNYTENDAVQTSDEFTQFFSALTKQALSINNEIVGISEDIEETATGGCANSAEPDFVEITPDEFKKCNNEGCLFCMHYRLRTIERDIRKLLSLQFIIEETRKVAKSASHFELVFKLPLRRINELFNVLNDQKPESAEMVELIRIDVYENERLSPYWQAKYNQMIELGIM